MDAALHVLIVTEDSGKQAQPVWRALLAKAFRLVDPACETQRIKFSPPDGATEQAARGNAWKARTRGGKRGQRGAERAHAITLRRELASWLLRSAEYVVCYHYDGDQTWSSGSGSAHGPAFQDEIAAKVRTIVEDPALVATHRTTPPVGLDGEALERAMRRLIEVVPHYSVEAWLYQNTATARQACVELGDPPDLTAQIEMWAADRSLLDEIDRPKDNCGLGDRYNLKLATSAWPAAAVFAVEKSFHATVSRMKAAEDLVDALARTHA